MVAFGEVGLSGEVRAVSMAKQRVAEAEKLGFEECVVPYVSLEECKKEAKSVSSASAPCRMPWTDCSKEAF